MLEVTTKSTLLRLMLLWGHLRSSTTLWTNTKFISIHFDLFCPPWINATSPQLAAVFSADWMRMLTKIMSPYGDWIQKKNKNEPYFVIQKKTPSYAIPPSYFMMGFFRNQLWNTIQRCKKLQKLKTVGILGPIRALYVANWRKKEKIYHKKRKKSSVYNLFLKSDFLQLDNMYA
jgi:hypothetical protein